MKTKIMRISEARKNIRKQVDDLYSGKTPIKDYSGCWGYGEIITEIKFPKILDNKTGYRIAERFIDSYK